MKRLALALLTGALLATSALPSTTDADFKSFMKKVKEDTKEANKKKNQNKSTPQQPTSSSRSAPQPKSPADTRRAIEEASQESKGQAPRASTAKVRVEPLFKIEQQYQRIVASPDGRKVASPMHSGSRVAIGINGEPGPPFDAVEFMKFSSDGSRFAYVARKSGKHYLVVDHEPVIEIPSNQYPEFHFSPNGRRYATITALRGGTARLVVDGKDVTPAGVGNMPSHQTGFRFSPDSKHYAFAATVKSKGGPYGGANYVFLDGKKVSGSSRVGDFTFSDRGGQLFYVEVENKGGIEDGRHVYRHIVHVICGKFVTHSKVKDGKHRGQYTFAFSEDGKHCAYHTPESSNRERKTTPVFVDGRPRKSVISVGGLRFSPNGARLAYVARTQGGQVLVIDGKVTSMEYEVVRDAFFSPNGDRVFAVAQHGGRYFLLADGKELGPFKEVTNFVFSEDGKRYAFVDGQVGGSGGPLIVDGKPVAGVEGVVWLTFIGNSPAYTYGRKLHLRGKTVETVNTWSSQVLVSEDGEHVAYGITRTGPDRRQIHNWVVDDVVLPVHPGHFLQTLSPNGSHFAAAGVVSTTGGILPQASGWRIFWDGLPVGPEIGANARGAAETTIADRGGQPGFMFTGDQELTVIAPIDGVVTRITVRP